ncbi:MAG: hypothetical protein GF347_03430 [Candidatus Moranbacteria bacterium]|nr:hypothetical protein [Candidatus Moranbacteria bacterium]
MKIKTKTAIALSLGIICFLFFNVINVYAAEFKVADEHGNLTVAEGERIKNLYAAGNIILIEGEIESDLYTAGNTITINGKVSDDVKAGGATVIVRGDIGGSVHVAGGNILIESKIKEDLFVAGGSVTLTKSALIEGDLIVAAGAVSIEAPILGDVKAAGGEIVINSRISGSVEANVEDKLILKEQAYLEKDLNYKSLQELEKDQNAVISGKTNFDKVKAKKTDTFKEFKLPFALLVVIFIVKLLANIILGLVLLYLFKNIIEKINKNSLTEFGKSLGLGFLGLIFVPIVCLLLFLTLLGIGLSSLLFLVYCLTLFLAASLAGIIFGSWMIKILKRHKDYSVSWPQVVLGITVLEIICLIPIMGWLVKFVFLLVSLGSLYCLTWQKIKTSSKKTIPKR